MAEICSHCARDMTLQKKWLMLESKLAGWQYIGARAPQDNKQQPPFYGNYTGQPALAGTSSWELEDFVGAKF